MIFLRHKRLRNSSRGVVAILALAMVVLIHTAHYGSSDAFIAARLPLRTSTSAAALERRVGSLSHTPLPPRIPLTALSDGLSAVSQRFQHQRRRSQDREGRNGFYTRVVVRISSAISSKPSPDDDDIDLTTAMANARANLAAGRSPGAGLDSAFDQADAAFADLIVTSVDDQDITLDDEDVEALAQGGMMDSKSRSKKSKGFFGDMSDVFGALSGGAHIVKREDGTL